ncbi:hypothetical protein, partial [Propionibacterium freudenreichii]|uniref:hypothetical protein n=1 Tax=Propionibacterium freudenreichii TaxID=1744 RepID=UPI00254C499A
MRDEWLRQFRATQGRDPSPEEFLTAQQAGFPVQAPAQPQAPGQPQAPAPSQTPDARWLAVFRASQGRLPSTQEFAAARGPAGRASRASPRSGAESTPARRRPKAAGLRASRLGPGLGDSARHGVRGR